MYVVTLIFLLLHEVIGNLDISTCSLFCSESYDRAVSQCCNCNGDQCPEGHYCTEYGCSNVKLKDKDGNIIKCVEELTLPHYEGTTLKLDGFKSPAVYTTTGAEDTRNGKCLCAGIGICESYEVCSEFYGCIPRYNIQIGESREWSRGPGSVHRRRIQTELYADLTFPYFPQDQWVILENPPDEVKTNIKTQLLEYGKNFGTGPPDEQPGFYDLENHECSEIQNQIQNEFTIKSEVCNRELIAAQPIHWTYTHKGVSSDVSEDQLVSKTTTTTAGESVYKLRHNCWTKCHEGYSSDSTMYGFHVNLKSGECYCVNQGQEGDHILPGHEDFETYKFDSIHATTFSLGNEDCKLLTINEEQHPRNPTMNLDIVRVKDDKANAWTEEEFTDPFNTKQRIECRHPNCDRSGSDIVQSNIDFVDNSPTSVKLDLAERWNFVQICTDCTRYGSAFEFFIFSRFSSQKDKLSMNLQSKCYLIYDTDVVNWFMNPTKDVTVKNVELFEDRSMPDESQWLPPHYLDGNELFDTGIYTGKHAGRGKKATVMGTKLHTFTGNDDSTFRIGDWFAATSTGGKAYGKTASATAICDGWSVAYKAAITQMLSGKSYERFEKQMKQKFWYDKGCKNGFFYEKSCWEDHFYRDTYEKEDYSWLWWDPSKKKKR